MTNSHTSSWALYDPMVAEYASKLEAILEPYEDVMPSDVQIPYLIGVSMVKASDRGEMTTSLRYLDDYHEEFSLSETNPHNLKWMGTKAFFINMRNHIDHGRKRDTWSSYYRWLKLSVDKYLQYDGKFQAVYYNMLDM